MQAFQRFVGYRAGLLKLGLQILQAGVIGLREGVAVGAQALAPGAELAALLLNIALF